MAKLKHTKEQVIEAIKTARGMKTGICELLDISRPTLDRYLKNADIAEALDFAKMRLKDRAEYKLAEAIEKAEPWALMFTLKNARDREYNDRVEHTGKDGEPLIPITVVEVVKHVEKDE